ncbi:hypothetical protein AMTRI_Chr12g269240 [Amborella trichopoda]
MKVVPRGSELLLAVHPQLLKKSGSTHGSPQEGSSRSDECHKLLGIDPVLCLLDYNKSFEVHTDTSDFAIGGVLMQEGHPVAYESWKLNDTERR